MKRSVAGDFWEDFDPVAGSASSPAPELDEFASFWTGLGVEFAPAGVVEIAGRDPSETTSVA